jgi:hypothetical protein
VLTRRWVGSVHRSNTARCRACVTATTLRNIGFCLYTDQCPSLRDWTVFGSSSHLSVLSGTFCNSHASQSWSLLVGLLLSSPHVKPVLMPETRLAKGTPLSFGYKILPTYTLYLPMFADVDFSRRKSVRGFLKKQTPKNQVLKTTGY